MATYFLISSALYILLLIGLSECVATIQTYIPSGIGRPSSMLILWFNYVPIRAYIHLSHAIQVGVQFCTLFIRQWAQAELLPHLVFSDHVLREQQRPVLILSHYALHIWIFELEPWHLISKLCRVVAQVQHYLLQYLRLKCRLKQFLQVSLHLIEALNDGFCGLAVGLSSFTELHSRLAQATERAVFEFPHRGYKWRDHVCEFYTQLIWLRYDHDLVRIAVLYLFLHGLYLVGCGRLVLGTHDVVLLEEFTACDDIIQLRFHPSQDEQVVELF